MSDEEAFTRLVKQWSTARELVRGVLNDQHEQYQQSTVDVVAALLVVAGH